MNDFDDFEDPIYVSMSPLLREGYTREFDPFDAVENSLMEGVTAEKLGMWLEKRELLARSGESLDWWHKQRLELVQFHHEGMRDTCGLCKRLTRCESYALLRPEDQPCDLDGGAT